MEAQKGRRGRERPTWYGTTKEASEQGQAPREAISKKLTVKGKKEKLEGSKTSIMTFPFLSIKV